LREGRFRRFVMIVKAVKALILFVVGVLALGLVEPALAEETPNAADAPQPDGERGADIADAVTGVTQTVDATVRPVAAETTATVDSATRPVAEQTAQVATTATTAAQPVVEQTARTVESTVRPVVEETARTVAPVTQAVEETVRPVVETARGTVDGVVETVTPPPSGGDDRGADPASQPSRSAPARDKAEPPTQAPEHAGGGEPPRAAPVHTVPRQPARTMRSTALAGSDRAERRARGAHAGKRHARGQGTVRHSPAAPALDLAPATAASRTVGDHARSASRRDGHADAGGNSRLPQRTHRGPRSIGSTASAASGSGSVPACGRPGFQLASDGELRRLQVVDARRPDDTVVLQLERPG
jgi:hypothetical protein